MSYYYKILFFSFIIPFLYSFHPRIKFNKKFLIILKSIPLAAIPFILWDIVFTKHSIWGFNQNFISGLEIAGLPIEEVLFFIIIPYCCIFTYHLLEINKISFFKFNKYKELHTLLAIVVLLIGVVNISKRYTALCFILFALILLIFTRYSNYKDYDTFYTNFILTMIPFIVVNGALTGLFYGQTVVWYSMSEILNIRITTIPIEDIFYCHQLLLMNIITYKNIESRI